jgi:hypothetical protein
VYTNGRGGGASDPVGSAKRESDIDCFSCRYSFVTCDQQLPYGCRAARFKSRRIEDSPQLAAESFNPTAGLFPGVRCDPLLLLTRGFLLLFSNRENGKKSFMTASDSLGKRRFLLLLVAFIVLSAFTADVFDLREELNILPCLYTDIDNNVAAGMINSVAVEPEPVCTLRPVQRQKSLAVSSLYHVPCGFRAPPSLA